MSDDLHLATPPELVHALYDACAEFDAAVHAGDDAAALAALAAFDSLVAPTARFHTVDVDVDADAVETEPLDAVRQRLARRQRPVHVIGRDHLVAAFDERGGIDVFDCDTTRVREVWSLDTSPQSKPSR